MGSKINVMNWVGKELGIVRKVENTLGFFAVGNQANEFLQFNVLANVLELWLFQYQLVWMATTCQTHWK